MDRFEYKEGILLADGQAAADSIRAVLAALSAWTADNIEESCDLSNQ